MDFINEVNEQYLEKLKTEALERRISSAKKDIPLAVMFVFGGIVLLTVSYFLLFQTSNTMGNLSDDLLSILLGGVIGFLGIAGSLLGGYCIFEDCCFFN